MAMLDTIVQVRLPSGEVVDIVDWSDLPLFSTVDLQSGFTQQEIDSYFQYVVGESVPGIGNGSSAAVKRNATENDTNVSTAGGMTTNEEMLVYAIKPEVYLYTTPTSNDFTSRSILDAGEDAHDPIGMPSASPEALAVFNATLLLRLIVTQKIKSEAGFGYFNTGFGAMQQSVIVPGTADSFAGTATAGLPSQEAVRSLVVPVHIGAQNKYRVMLLNPTGEAVNFGVTETVNDGTRVTRDDVMASIRINLDGLYKRPTA